jgi:hypothetical protein
MEAAIGTMTTILFATPPFDTSGPVLLNLPLCLFQTGFQGLGFFLGGFGFPRGNGDSFAGLDGGLFGLRSPS